MNNLFLSIEFSGHITQKQIYLHLSLFCTIYQVQFFSASYLIQYPSTPRIIVVFLMMITSFYVFPYGGPWTKSFIRFMHVLPNWIFFGTFFYNIWKNSFDSSMCLFLRTLSCDYRYKGRIFVSKFSLQIHLILISPPF